MKTVMEWQCSGCDDWVSTDVQSHSHGSTIGAGIIIPRRSADLLRRRVIRYYDRRDVCERCRVELLPLWKFCANCGLDVQGGVR
jgi:hypothetical protein